jgi:predicted GNAT family acetyltransferase
MDDAELELLNNEATRRWEVRQGDEVIAYAEYRATADRMIFTHTVVRPEFEGRGIGSRLARTALDDAVARGLRITPYCPFIRAYLRRHPDYGQWVDLPPPGPDGKPDD